MSGGIDVSFLRGVPLFVNLDSEELERTSSMLEVEEFEEGERVFSVGDPEQCLYIIRKGAVKISRKIEGGVERSIAVFKQRDFFGELSLVEVATHSVNAICLTHVTLFKLKKTDFGKMMDVYPDLCLKMFLSIVRVVGERLRRTDDQMMDLILWGAKVRGIQTRFRQLVDECEKIRLNLQSGKQIVGKIRGYERGLGGIELLFEDSDGHTFIIPYHAVQYFVIES